MTAAGKARGIIFRGDEVRSAREGRKTQFRRVVKSTARGCTVGVYSDSDRGPYECVNVGDDGDPIDSEPIRCPYGVPGDRLWVRETICTADASFGGDNYYFAADRRGVGLARYAALVKRFPWKYGRVIPSIFMPREASRLDLLNRQVRVERLSAISNEDAIAEGIDWQSQVGVDGNGPSPREFFMDAFRAMHKLAAAADPWLWVVTFSKEPANG